MKLNSEYILRGSAAASSKSEGSGMFTYLVVCYYLIYSALNLEFQSCGYDALL